MSLNIMVIYLHSNYLKVIGVVGCLVPLLSLLAKKYVMCGENLRELQIDQGVDHCSQTLLK